MANEFNLDLLNNLSEEERKVAMSILDEYSKDGSSKKYDELLYSDYKEIPVDILTFVHDDRYLGRALKDESGKCTVYPYWLNVLQDIFPDPYTVKYNTVIFTGGIGLGKSTIADIGNAYQMYKVLCLKDAFAFYGLQKIDTISIAFLNNTIENAKDVAWRKFHNMLCMSPWFTEHGVINKLKKEVEWEPLDNSELNLIAGSSGNHLIGKCVFSCLDGNTLIKTSIGDFPIKELVGKTIKVICLDDEFNETVSDWCTVLPTRTLKEEYVIELEDGTPIVCTPNHRFLLKDGTYKEAQYLTEQDELFDTNL